MAALTASRGITKYVLSTAMKDIYPKDRMLKPTCTITPLSSGFPTLRDTNIPGLTVLRSVKTEQVSKQQLTFSQDRKKLHWRLLLASVAAIYHLPAPLLDGVLPV